MILAVSWLKTNAKVNPAVKLYIGLPASTGAAPHDTPAYLTPKEAYALINSYRTSYPATFGGVMVGTIPLHLTTCTAQ